MPRALDAEQMVGGRLDMCDGQRWSKIGFQLGY